MATTKLDKSGRLDLPRTLLDSHHWRAGTEFIIEDRPDGLLLRALNAPRKPERGKTKGKAVTEQGGSGCDRTLADAMRERYARLGH
jgi:bifunctional DNA-binding transcriptional regulator/antitoxin component of YhaV-PrlF toxin-antitoxin module